MPEPGSPENQVGAEETGVQDAVVEQVEQQPNLPVVEDENSVTYMGVRLEKAHVESQFVPKRESYAGEKYIQDRFSLELQKKFAVSFLQSEPILLEGGTSIGKTTTVRKMAAELGWEVHYVNLNGASDVEDLMGRYIPNPHRERIDDPEYIFADGKVTSGLRIEEGKRKIIVLDEYNSAAPNITIRLHEVLDALERNGEIVLSEDASETVGVNKDQTKIVGLTNPPGKGFIGREPLDPAQLRRWNYQKEVTNLPEQTFSYSTDVLFGLAKETDTNAVPQESYLTTRDQALPREQLKEIPGIEEVLGKYKEFHRAAKEMVANRSVAADQPQKFSYDDRMEPRRVTEFVQQFYNGDINETFQKALRYYYSNKLEGTADRQKLEELIRHVAFVPQQETKRRGAEREGLGETTVTAEELLTASRVEATPLTGELLEQVTEAQRILGEYQVIAPNRVAEILGVKIDLEKVEPIPFSKQELERAKELGQFLIYRQGKDERGDPLTMERLDQILQPKFDRDKDGKVLYDRDWYKDEDFFKKEAVRSGWALTSREVIPDSTSKNYLQQTGELAKYVDTQVGPDISDPLLRGMYTEAIKEFDAKRGAIEKLMGSDWQEAAKQLSELKINQLFRQTPVEAMYDTTVFFEANRAISASHPKGARLMEGMYSWTNQRSSDGLLVYAGYFLSRGLSVDYAYPDISSDDLGVSFSRNQKS
ncbi:MAG: AAA family ATPase [Patescibacteria group bacterium]